MLSFNKLAAFLAVAVVGGGVGALSVHALRTERPVDESQPSLPRAESSAETQRLAARLAALQSELESLAARVANSDPAVVKARQFVGAIFQTQPK